MGNGDVVAAYPALDRRASRSKILSRGDSIKKEGSRAEGKRSHFSLRQQFKLNFFERPSDQKRAAKNEEGRGGSASWSGSQEALSVGSVGTHTEGHAAAAAARGRSIQRDESG